MVYTLVLSGLLFGTKAQAAHWKVRITVPMVYSLNYSHSLIIHSYWTIETKVIPFDQDGPSELLQRIIFLQLLLPRRFAETLQYTHDRPEQQKARVQCLLQRIKPQGEGRHMDAAVLQYLSSAVPCRCHP